MLAKLGKLPPLVRQPILQRIVNDSQKMGVDYRVNYADFTLYHSLFNVCTSFVPVWSNTCIKVIRVDVDQPQILMLMRLRSAPSWDHEGVPIYIIGFLNMAVIRDPVDSSASSCFVQDDQTRRNAMLPCFLQGATARGGRL